MSVLAVKNLVKRYGDIEAVAGVSFEIEQGCCFGLLGPNGAGKSTTLEMAEGILLPSSGTVLFKGELLNENFYQRIGIQFQTTALQDFITVKETLSLFSRFYQKTTPLDELIVLCALESILSKDTSRLSGGQRQRLLLALALLNDPEILFLDEPTTGLDPQSRHNFWELLNEIKQQRKTIILSTHYMQEAEQLCDRIAIMDKGKIIVQGHPKHLMDEALGKQTLIRLPMRRSDEFSFMSFEAKAVDGYWELMSDNLDETIGLIIAAGISLQGMQLKAPSVEDLFLHLTGRELRS